MFYCMTKGAKSLISINNLRNKLFLTQLEIFRYRFGRQIVPAFAGQNRLLSMASKPPNILIYSKNDSIKNFLIETLRRSLKCDTYTIYPITDSQVEAQAWPESTALVLIHGTLDACVANIFLDYFLKGGKLLGLCSDLDQIVLPHYVRDEQPRTANVTLNFDKWKNIAFVQKIIQWKYLGNEEKFKDLVKNTCGREHELDVEILARDTNLNIPSILKITNMITGGEGIFTQLVLTDTDNNGPDLLMHLLSTCLKIQIEEQRVAKIDKDYNCAFLLGSVADKQEFLKLVNDKNPIKNVLNAGELSLKFLSKTERLLTPSECLLPVMIDRETKDFLSEPYFTHLTTSQIGRTGIFCPVITSSMIIVSNATLNHGFVVIPRRQLRGCGRNQNQWLSPEGCVMFSLQLHVPLSSPLGRRLPLIQQLGAVAAVNAIRSISGYEQLEIGLKWPNDIYAKGSTKIGGLIINSQLCNSQAIVNIGCGVNLNNSNPTICINELIMDYNREKETNLPLLDYEQTLAIFFNEFENLYTKIQSSENWQHLYELYYKYWLHDGKIVAVRDVNGSEITGTIVGIDEYGYLLVKHNQKLQPICVHPDGNSFNMMKGLIIPKYF